MGAVPKNRITSVERGKRRAGNRPKLRKNLKQAKTPLHKRGLVAQMFKRMGLDLKSKIKSDQAEAKKTSKKSAKKSAKKSTKKKTKKTSKKSKSKSKK